MKTVVLCFGAILLGVAVQTAADPQHYPKPAYPAQYGQKYDYCDPRKAPKCAEKGNQTFCLKDSEYPSKEVKYAIEYDPLVLRKYADVADQSADNLVDGLTSLSENHFDYPDYHGKTFEKSNWVGDEGYICPSDVLYAHPLRAVNADGEWRVIVQDIAWPGYTQTQRIETCLFPGASCKKNVSESDTDNEKNTEASFTTVNLPIPAQKYDPTKAPPVPPRKTSPKKTSDTSTVSSLSDSLSQLNDDVARNKELMAHVTDALNMDRQELINGSVGTLNIEERTFQLQVSTEGQNEFATPQGETKESSNEGKLNNQANPVTETVETVFSPSDSEFEVISMPHNIRLGSEYTPLPGDTSALMSDYDDSSSDGFNSENEHEFKDCKQPSPDVSNNLQPGGSLYPELELKKMSLSLMSSTTSTLLDGYVSSCSTDGAVAVQSTVIEIERERSPYSVPPEDVEKINSQEIVHNQPLPSEFLRDRKPYSHVPLEEPKQPPPQSPQQQTQVPKVSRPSQQNQRDSTYRVDNLPESLWDEALTVAAQTYNAAKSAVGTLADTFVPGVAAQAVASNPQPRNSPVRVQPAYRVEMAEKEQKLFEMGFLDHGLNATLLVRHNGDMGRVIAELIEP